MTSTELGYLSGVTSNIQTQLDGKVNIDNSEFRDPMSQLSIRIDEIHADDNEYRTVTIMDSDMDYPVRLNGIYDPVSEYCAANKNYVDQSINSLPKVYSGTAVPSSELGNDGDIYVRYSIS